MVAGACAARRAVDAFQQPPPGSPGPDLRSEIRLVIRSASVVVSRCITDRIDGSVPRGSIQRLPSGQCDVSSSRTKPQTRAVALVSETNRTGSRHSRRWSPGGTRRSGRDRRCVDLDGADYVAFTGSTATGRKIAARAGERLIGSSLELGGKNPMIVLADADLWPRRVPRLAAGELATAGQVCSTTERLYVHMSIFEKFVDFRPVARRRAMRAGASMDFESDMGPLTTATGLRRTSEAVEQAKASGAQVHAGGHAPPDLGSAVLRASTILSGVTAAADLHTAEVFGPVVSVYGFETVKTTWSVSSTRRSTWPVGERVTRGHQAGRQAGRPDRDRCGQRQRCLHRGVRLLMPRPRAG